MVLVAVLLAASIAHADPSGHKWFTLPVSYRVAQTVDNDGTTNVIQGGQQSAGLVYDQVVVPTIQQMFQTWTKNSVSGTTWDTTYTGVFTTPQGRSALNASDNINNIIFLSGNNWMESSATLGLTFTTAINATGEIIDADTEFNNSTVTWDNSTQDGLSFDYPSVILHEAGHFLGLNHTANSLAVMYFQVSYADAKRVLTSNDINDVTGVYPVAMGGQGTTCVLGGSGCTSPLLCRAGSGATSGVCTVDCTNGGIQCPTGYTCQVADTGKACLPQLSAPDLCKFCTSGPDCSTGVCVTDGVGHNWCTNSCTSSAACGAGYTCLANFNLCAPPLPWTTSSCPNQCTNSNQCPSGYSCIAGACAATGNLGDRCEVSAWCNNCLVCVGDTMQANCRACCGGTQLCNMCNPVNCGMGATCTGLTSGDSVCVPNVVTNTCQAGCTQNADCPTGESCKFGACHTSCNPMAPGGCTACFDIGGGEGVCACPNEIADQGQQCGLVGQQFFACHNGFACVGTPSTCQRICDPADMSSCNLGEACMSMGGSFVCVAGTIGSECAACGTNNACSPGLTCVEQRCYRPCSGGASNVCEVGSVCVPQAQNGDGVCACPDQVKPNGGACSNMPIAACASGLTCVQNICRGQCDPNAITDPCNILETCQPYMGGNYCLPLDMGTGGGAGGGAGGGGGGKHTGGGGGSVANNTGCACNAGAGALWPVVGLLMLAIRRRRS